MHDDALGWIHQHLKQILAVEAVQDWELSTLLRVRTIGGVAYFKACHPLPLSADEARLTALLTRLYPDALPELIAVEVERGWLLMRDAGATLRAQPEFDLWRRALLGLGQIQRNSTQRVDDLITAGCPDRRPERFDDLIDDLLANEAMLAALDAHEVERLRALAPALHQKCRVLRLIALVHGDFHGGNIGWKDGQARFLDWSESCIGHPFFDLPVMLKDAATCFPPKQVDALRDQYLAIWQNGQREWQNAAPLAALYHAMMYNGVAERIAPDKPRVRVAGWLRLLLASA